MNRWLFAIGCTASAAALVLAISMLFDVHPRSLWGWLALVLLGILVWLTIEGLGQLVLSAPFWKRLTAPIRIAFAVPVVAALGGVALWFASIVRAIIEKL